MLLIAKPEIIMNAKELSAQVSDIAFRINTFVNMQTKSTKAIISGLFSVSIHNNEIVLICASKAAYDALMANGYEHGGESVRVFIEPDD